MNSGIALAVTLKEGPEAVVVDPKAVVRVIVVKLNKEAGRLSAIGPSVDQSAYLTEPPFANFNRHTEVANELS
jgi:hypothetical protein